MHTMTMTIHDGTRGKPDKTLTHDARGKTMATDQRLKMKRQISANDDVDDEGKVLL